MCDLTHWWANFTFDKLTICRVDLLPSQPSFSKYWLASRLPLANSGIFPSISQHELIHTAANNSALTLTVSHLYFRRRQIWCRRRAVVFRPIFSQQQCRHDRHSDSRTDACLLSLTSAQRKPRNQRSKFTISVDPPKTNNANAKSTNVCFRSDSRQSQVRQQKTTKINILRYFRSESTSSQQCTMFLFTLAQCCTLATDDQLKGDIRLNESGFGECIRDARV